MSVHIAVLKDCGDRSERRFCSTCMNGYVFILPDLYMNTTIMMINEDACVNHDMCIST